MLKVLIKNGIIVDGTGKKTFKGDLLIEDSRIKEIGKVSENADKIIDAKGRVVSPGFIDTHSHSDLMILVNPYNEIKIRQGITTEVLGQDGISMAPLPTEFISPWRKNIAGLDGDTDESDWEYETTENYLKMMKDNGVEIGRAHV